MSGVVTSGHVERKEYAHARIPGSLLVGAMLFAVVLTINIAAYVLPEEQRHDDLQYEPPHVAVLQRLLWRNSVRDTVVQLAVLSDLGGNAAPAQKVFQSVPPAIAREAQKYQYQPLASVPLGKYTLEGKPPGIEIDSESGVISGIPTTVGRYKVKLSAELANGDSAQQHFTMFVDNRFLLLGADVAGRDVLRRIITAAKYMLEPGLLAVLIGVVGGVAIGAFAGFYSGFAQRALPYVVMTIQSVPALLLVFLAAVGSEYKLRVVMVVVGLILLPETANGVRERVASFRQRDFVEAARELGMRDRSILWNEIIWHNARGFIVTRITQGFVFAILVEITLSYMGFTNPGSGSLGMMVREGRDALTDGYSAAVSVAPIAALLVVIGAFSLVEKGVLGLWERRRA